MKIALVLVWIVCAAAFVLPEAAWTVPAKRLFFALIVVHAVECVAFLPRLRAAGGSLAQQIVQTMLFGFLHLRSLRSS